MMANIAMAVATLHAQGIIHHDIKRENILICAGFVAKLAEFGCNEITFAGIGSKQIIGSFGYLAPEMMLGKSTTFAVDVWAFGITLYEVVFSECIGEEHLTCSNA